MTRSSSTLAKWLTRHLTNVPENEHPISRLELVHVVEGRHADRLQIWRVNSGSRCDPDELAQEVTDAADADVKSRDSGQPQRYVLYAFRGPDAQEPEAQYAFQLKPPMDISRRGGDSEPPTREGIVAHYMRHDENVHRILLGASEALVGKLTDDLERERAARVRAEELNWSMNDRYQKLLDMEHERRLREAKELMKARRIDELMGLATALLPIVVAKLAGAAATQVERAAPASPPHLLQHSGVELPNAQDLAIRQFFEGLSEHEIAVVLGSLETSSQIALSELYREFMQGAQHPADAAARQIGIRKFLKSLSEAEITRVLGSLSAANRAQLLALYSQFRAVEDAEQEQKPEILRS